MDALDQQSGYRLRLDDVEQAGGLRIAKHPVWRSESQPASWRSFHRLEDTPAYAQLTGEMEPSDAAETLSATRYYDAKKLRAVAFQVWGAGTAFSYQNARVSSSIFRDVDGVTVTVDVTNTGKVAGKEIVQVYVHDQKSSLVRPEKELKGFAKVELQPGETKTVSIALDFRAFAFYHPSYQQWITENGEFDILVAASSADIRAVLPVTLQSTLELPCVLDKESTIREWMDDPHGKVVISPLLAQIETMAAAVFGGDESAGEKSAIGMDVLAMFGDMPLVSVLGFLQGGLPRPADEIAGEMLAQAHGMGR